MPARLVAVLLLIPATLRAAPLQTDSTWRDHNRAADAATSRRDWPDARRHLQAVDDLLGGHPSVAMALARNAARSGDTGQALAQLRRVAAMGVLSRGTSDTAFDGLRQAPGFAAVSEAIAANGSRIGAAEVVVTLPDSAAINEDLAWDPARSRWLVTDVRGHQVTQVGRDGRAARYGPELPAGWAVLGIAVDLPRQAVWITTVTLPQAAGYAAADSGRAAILRLDLATGTVRRRFDFPAPSRAAPGDLLVAENGDLFSGDGQTGAVYVVRHGRDSLEVLVPAGRMRGSQQPALAPDGRSIFIADYGRGIARVDRASGALAWLHRPDSVTLTGIDGLLWLDGGLVAVQNGVSPSRIVRLELDPGLAAISNARILLRDGELAGEPTHIAVVSGRLYAIGNAGWEKYGDDGAPAANVQWARPRIVRITGAPPR